MTGPADDHAKTDAALIDWRQGDCVVDSTACDDPSRPVASGLWFLFRAAVEAPLTKASHEGADPETGNTEERVEGFAVLTQTCDLVRSCAERPYVEIAPLKGVCDEDWRNIERCRQPRYASLPGLAGRRLVVDLDRVMTVEKGVVAQWIRVAGCATDAERRSFAEALRRKRGRAAFPDDFVA